MTTKRKLPRTWLPGEKELWDSPYWSAQSDTLGGWAYPEWDLQDAILGSGLEYIQSNKKYFRNRILAVMPNLTAIEMIEFYGLHK